MHRMKGRGPITSRRPALGRLIQVTYVSTATGVLCPERLAALAARARARNVASGLTGFLFHQPPRFFGLLEGPERRVLARMEAIIANPDHCNLTVLREEEVTVPRFLNWSFGVLPADAGPNTTVSAEFVRSLAGAGRRSPRG